MPIGKKTIEQMARLSKKTVKEIEDAIAAENEVDLDIPDTLAVFTPEELTARDGNAGTENRTKWIKEGETQGKELVAKTLKDKLGLATATKDIDAVIAEAQTKLTGETALQDQIKLLQSEVGNKDKEVKRLEKQLGQTAKEREMLAMLPAKKNPEMTNDEHLDFINRNIKDNGDGTFSYKGEVMRDATTKNALPLDKVIEHMYTDRKTILMAPAEGGGGERGGRGSGDSGGGKGGAASTTGVKNIGDARRNWQAANPEGNWGGEESQIWLRQVMKENPDMTADDSGD